MADKSFTDTIHDAPLLYHDNGDGTFSPVVWQGGGTSGFTSSATFTATAVAYTANNTMGAAQQFTTIGVSGKNIIITGAELEIDTTALQSGETTYRLYLYNVTPPSALANNTAWDLPSGDRASFLGFVDLPAPVDLGSTCYGQAINLNKEVLLSGTGIFAYLVTVGAFTATAIARKVTLHARSLA